MSMNGSDRGDILVVDDTPANVQLLSIILEKNGCRVRAAPDGALAIEMAKADPPELILLDVAMPQMDGFEVCARLKQDPALSTIPVIFLTALKDTPDKVKAFAAGCVDYVTKPFRAREILARIDTHLSLRRLRVALEHSNRELEKSNARLRETDQMRRSLLQMIVHDLKNPIMAIELNAGIIRRDAGLKGELSGVVEDIHALSSVMSRMVLDVLDVAHAEQATLQPRFGLVDLRALFRDVVNDMRLVTSGARKLAAYVAEDTQPTVWADRELLRRVLANLVDNSMKYAPRSTEIRLEAAPDGPASYSLRVRDEGPGIPVQQRERIFLPHARLERDLETNARTSRGLGLAFCKLAVEAHRGRIWVHDNEPSGSVFVVRLPLDPTAEASPRAQAAAMASA